ncbi:MAG: sortase [Anaerolineaceae bacterium]|nr:sortase [Anaerolineaceae bacterium]
MNKDISGKLLFIIGLALIGASIFNIFEEPIMNQFYKYKRLFSTTGNNQAPTVNIPDLPHQQIISETQAGRVPTEDSIQNEELIDFSEFTDEGFLPVNVEVSSYKKLTPEKTKEFAAVPVRISIPSIDLTADIIHATNKEIIQGDKTYIQWLAPDEYAIGWHFDSAFLGEPGNTVLNGHHNVYGKVFENLDKLVSGDEIFIYGNDFQVYQYVVSNTMILAERDVSFEERLDNARWILPSEDERITLITCWPNFSNTHRLIIVASPIGFEPIPISNERN